MQEELLLNGEKYISSRQAAREIGYTNDYIGRLCREKKIKSRMVGRNRFVNKSSLLIYKKNRKENKNSGFSYIKKNSNLISCKKSTNFLSSSIDVIKSFDYFIFTQKVITSILIVMVITGGYDFSNIRVVSADYDFISDAKNKILSTTENFNNNLFKKDANQKSFLEKYVVENKISNNNLAAVEETSDDLDILNKGVEVIKSEIEKVALNIYKTFFGLFKKSDQVVVVEKEIITEKQPIQNIEQTIINNPIREVIKEKTIERTIEKIVSGVSSDDLQKVNNELRSEIYRVANNASTQSNQNYRTIALTNKIDNLSSVNITNSTITNTSISGSTGSFTNLSLSSAVSSISRSPWCVQ